MHVSRLSRLAGTALLAATALMSSVVAAGSASAMPPPPVPSALSMPAPQPLSVYGGTACLTANINGTASALPCSAWANQKFTFDTVILGMTVKDLYNRCLTTTTAWAGIYWAPCNGSTTQAWTFESGNPVQASRLRSVASSQVLSLRRDSTVSTETANHVIFGEASFFPQYQPQLQIGWVDLQRG